MEPNRENAKTLYTAYSERFMQGMNGAERHPDAVKAEDIAEIIPSTASSATHDWLGQLPVMKEWTGDRSVVSLQLERITVENLDWEQTVKVPVNAIEDESYGAYGNLMEAMGGVARQLWIDLALKALLANGNWADGKPFFGSGRVLGSGSAASTITNAVTAAFSEAALKAAWETMAGWTLDQGRSARAVPTVLLVGPSNYFAAKKLLRGELKGGGDTNELRGIVELKMSRDLVGANAGKWFLFGEAGGVKALGVQKRKDPQFTAMDAPNDENVFTKNEIRYGTHARGSAFLALPFLAYAGGLSTVPSAAPATTES